MDNAGADAIEGQLRECFGRVAYSHKTHEKCADIVFKRMNRLKLIQIALSAVTTGGLLGSVFGNTYWTTVLATIASTCLLAVNAYTKQTDLGALSQKHAQTAGKLWDIRETYISLLTDLKANAITLDEARKTRDQLQKNLLSVYQSAPRTTADAYLLAQGALKNNEELTFSDHEIDVFLPRELRRDKT
jgi:hypothetical protein